MHELSVGAVVMSIYSESLLPQCARTNVVAVDAGTNQTLIPVVQLQPHTLAETEELLLIMCRLLCRQLIQNRSLTKAVAEIERDRHGCR